MEESIEPPGHLAFPSLGRYRRKDMSNFETRASLLLRIRDANNIQAWTDFVEIYMPLLHAYAMRNGLQDADAADLAQDTVRQVVRAISRFEYDKAKGSFRGWLLAIARNEIRKQVKQRSKHGVGSGDSEVNLMLQQEAAPADDAEWEREYQLHLFHWAANRVKVEFRENSWQAFWQTVVEGKEIASVAEELKVSPGAIYIARSRVLARIREEIETAEREDG